MLIGNAIDIHSFSNQSDDGCLKLGTIEIKTANKLVGHSDGDAVCHSIADSLLLAAGLPDLGMQIGTDRPEWKNASGKMILSHIMHLIEQKGFRIVNITVQIVCKRPKISDYADLMSEQLSQILKCQVRVGATTTDNNIAELGDGRALMATSTVLLDI